MPHVIVFTWQGKNRTVKETLVRAITNACSSALGVSPSMVSVMLIEVPKENWATGGILDSERECGCAEPATE